jgi:hypothetical protein
VWTGSFNHEIRRVLLESGRQLHLGHLYPIETVCLLALLAIEVRMQIVVVVIMVTMTELVAGTIATTLDGVHQVVLAEKRKGTENIGFVYRLYTMLKLCQRLRLDGRSQGLDHHNTVGCGLDTMLFEQSNIIRFVHDLIDFVGKDTKKC